MKKGSTTIFMALLLASINAYAANAEGGKPSCLKTVGAKQSAIYANECLMVSGATRPPCNAQNSCELLISEIRVGCNGIHAALLQHPEWGSESRKPAPLKEPSFCKSFLE